MSLTSPGTLLDAAMLIFDIDAKEMNRLLRLTYIRFGLSWRGCSRNFASFCNILDASMLPLSLARERKRWRRSVQTEPGTHVPHPPTGKQLSERAHEYNHGRYVSVSGPKSQCCVLLFGIRERSERSDFQLVHCCPRESSPLPSHTRLLIHSSLVNTRYGDGRFRV